MEEFGIQRQELLSQFLDLLSGIPDSDTFRRVFERLNPEALSGFSQSGRFSVYLIWLILNAVALPSMV